MVWERGGLLGSIWSSFVLGVRRTLGRSLYFFPSEVPGSARAPASVVPATVVAVKGFVSDRHFCVDRCRVGRCVQLLDVVRVRSYCRDGHGGRDYLRGVLLRLVSDGGGCCCSCFRLVLKGGSATRGAGVPLTCSSCLRCFCVKLGLLFF